MKTQITRLALTVLAAGAFGSLTVGAHASGFQLVGGSGSPNSVTINAGQSFSFSVLLNADQPVTGVTYFLDAADPASGQFQLTGRSFGNSPFTDLTTDNATALQASDALLAPQNFDDLGGTIADVTTPLAAGNYTVSNLTLSSLPGLAPGVYTIQTAPTSTAIDANFNNLATTGGTFQINVVSNPVPEASTTISFGVLLALGFGGLLAARRRRNA